jgi:hypothetical protein
MNYNNRDRDDMDGRKGGSAAQEQNQHSENF